MDHFSVPHQANILIHVIAGSAALMVSLLIFILKKGGTTHRKLGRLFLIFVFIVIATGLMGVLIFGRNSFLLVLTILSGYSAYSGYRVLKIKTPNPLDITIASLTMTCGLFYVYYLNSADFVWSPIVIYSTLGTLFLYITYDFLRYLIPKLKYQKIFIYEHIYKMTSAFTALFAAFIGTVFSDYQPYSQLLPSAFGTFLAIALMLSYYLKLKSRKVESELPEMES